MKRSSFNVITVIISLLASAVYSQTVCSRPASLEWHTQQQMVQVKWTLMDNVCMTEAQCWAVQDTVETRQDGGRAYNSPQICPLELQHGDKLFFSTDRTLESYDIQLVNVSRENFESCSTANETPNQLLFTDNITGSKQVEPKWLLPGNRYFIALHDGNSQLCKLGLRLSVSVKGQRCQRSPLSRLCSGTGVCQTSLREAAYHCQCHQNHSGKFCEKFDVCQDNPCGNKGVCLSRGSTDPGHQTYKCLCPPHTTGVNCSEVIGQENCDRECLNGSCVKVSSTSFKCVCDPGYSGPPCEKRKAGCDSNPCRNGGECEKSSGGYVCLCLEGFQGLDCDTQVDINCMSHGCQHEEPCTLGEHCLCAPGWTGEFCQYAENACLIYPDQCRNGATCITTSQPTSSPQYSCICPPGYTGSQCETDINECDSSPCRHNGTCMDLVGFYRCRCPPGFLGTNCEVDIDACRLPNTTCPASTRCVDLPDGTQYTCRRPCPPNIQPCANGGRCLLNNASSYTCVCAPGWSGRNCRVNVNDCVRHWCQNGATCVDKIDGYSCVCPRGLSGAYCEEDIDHCVGHRCSEHGVCLDHRYNYTCRCHVGFEGSLCDLETDECRSFPCANGASCLDGVRDYQCICPSGFEGRTCSENINDCWSRPCLNGGSCVDLINDFACHCHVGMRYAVNAQQNENPSEAHRTLRGQRSSSGHAGVVREILEGGLTIDTLPDNMTHLVEDSGRYYSWRSFGPEAQRTDELWVDMSDTQHGQVRMHGILSNTHKQAAKVALSFDFPFYGHYLRQITIATGGFIFTGDVTHRMLTATQYIAPLMANFDPSFSKDSTVQYLDDGEVFVVQWERVRLQGRESEGAFTFQAALYSTGTITFSYRDIPLLVEDIHSAEHPVKAGLSDGFMVLQTSPRFPGQQPGGSLTPLISQSSMLTFYLIPMTTLTERHETQCCHAGVTCASVSRCSDGMDRHRQDWLDYTCSEAKDVTCEDYSREGPDSSIDPSGSEATTRLCPLQEDVKTGLTRQSGGSPHTGVIAGVVAAAVLLLALTLLALYIYSHPTAVSPLYLIQRRNKYWPSMKFRKQGFHTSYTEVEVEGHEKNAIVEAVQC